MRHILLAAMLWLPLLAAADPGYISEDTDLRDGPYADAKSLQQLPAATAVEIHGRQGGWYQVQAGPQQGWVRMNSLRLRAPGARAGVLEGGRGAATQSVATTGVRGFGAGELQKAAPDVDAVDKLEATAVAAADARSFAAAGNLQAKADADKGGSP
ncbi:MAG TPA: SH3 domain-containing protein [Nevskia sp.]|nr:SH3 domain-containing protein [Nevskia sp.]